MASVVKHYPYTETVSEKISLEGNRPFETSFPPIQDVTSIASTSPLKALYMPSQAWSNLNGFISLDADMEFWWRTTGPCLASMMEEAGYDLHSQYNGLLFHLYHVVPHLGPRPLRAGPPSQWRSFMTDDFSPLEYSWNWSMPAKGPMVRYSVEAIGPAAGTPQDPVNSKEIYRLLEKLKIAQPDVNLEWFDAFMDSFVGTDHSNIKSPAPTHSHPSSAFMAFELQKGKLASKAYFVPVKAEQLGVSRLQVLSESIQKLETDTIKFPAYRVFLNFLSKCDLGHQFYLIGVAIDCVEPENSRLKIYVRSLKTSFDSVCSVMTLDGRVPTLDHSGREELSDLWHRLLSLDRSYPADADLPPLAHETAGVLYNIDIKAGSTLPEMKVYVPVRHYGRSDLEVARGLTSYLEEQGRGRYNEAYLRVLEKIGAHRSLSEGCGLQTYISCAVKGGKLALTSYFAPEIYHSARWNSRE